MQYSHFQGFQVKHKSKTQFFLRTFCPIAIFVTFSQTLYAEALWRPMVEGLLQRKYYDTAQEYLQLQARSPRCPEDLKAEIDFQLGSLHLDALLRGGSPWGFETHVLQARTSFERFLQHAPDHAQAYQANSNLGKLSLELARRALARTLRENVTETEIETLRLEARRELDLAETYFNKGERIAYTFAKEMQLDPTVKNDPLRVLRRDTLYAQVLESRIQLAVLSYERARTYAQASREFEEAMKTSAQQFYDLAVKYHNYTGSLMAKLYQAKALHALNDDLEAKKIVLELLFLPEASPAFRPIVLEALQLFLDVNFALGSDRALAESLERIERWTTSTPRSERLKPAYARLNLLAGKTYLRLSESRKNNESEKAKNRALEFFSAVAAETPEALEARNLLERFDAAGLVTKFDTGNGAEDKGILYDGDGALRDVTDIKREAERKYMEFVRIGRFFNESENEEQSRHRQEQLTKQAEETLTLFRYLLAHPEEFRTEELNQLRLKLASVYWSLDRWEEACVLGGFLARRYPNTSFGSQGAEFLIKGLRKIFVQELAAQRDTSGVKARIVQASDLIATRWESLPVGQESISIRIETELDSGSWESAQQFIETLPENTSRRSSAELLLGQVLFNSLLEVVDTLEEDDPFFQNTDIDVTQNEREVETLYLRTRHYLEKGLAAKEKEIHSGNPVEYTSAFSAFLLARMHALRHRRDAALQVLENPHYGPLHLLSGSDENENENALSDEVLRWPVEFRISVLVFSLHLLIDTGQLESLTALLSRLESLVRFDQREEQSRLSKLYVLIGKRMEQRLQTLQKTGNEEEINAALSDFEAFLERVRLRDESGSEESLLWVASVFFDLGKTLGTSDEFGNVTPSQRGITYLEKAEGIYRTVLERTPADTALRYRLALTLREKGDLKTAYEMMLEILRESEDRIDVQLEAARTLQYRGRESVTFYSKAIVGDEKRPDGKFLVWGWNGLIGKTSQDFARFADMYYGSHYNKAVSRVLLSRALPAAQAKTMLQGAKSDLQRLRQLRPQVKQTPWSSKFDALLKSIEPSL